ncbi:LysR family transcriptional regulator [Clostridium bovifaecis]|uniref:LysR family transcriptional regulator n=1 Tax=Clostridium bovifaecis TaxID=2184719 RepID=A0A6I6EJY7_9CLOT|nr:LysR family transcriptional regulator [Clostridium bovifaecis]
MDIQFLRNFYDVATLKSISKVASLSHISQSALSQRILKLEQELGIPLLERSNKGTNITQEGELILRHVKTMIRAYDRIIEDISNIKDHKETFVVSSSSSEIDLITLRILLVIKEINDQWFFKINTMPKENTELELDRNLSDMAITYESIETDNITSFKVGTNELVFVANPKVDIEERVSISELYKYPFILLGDGPDIPNMLNYALKSKGYDIDDLQVVFTANSIGIAKESIEKTEDISLLPKICVEEEIEKGAMKTFKVEDLSFEYEVFFSYNKNSYYKSKKLIDIFKREAKKLLK